MDISDALLGKIILIGVISVFGYFAVWVTVYPFLEFEKDHWLYSVFPDPQYYLLFCALWGFCFIGSLMAFTYYQVRPYL